VRPTTTDLEMAFATLIPTVTLPRHDAGRAELEVPA